MDLNSILKRVGECIESNNEKDISEALGVELQVLSKWKTSGSLPYRELCRFAKRKKINPEWLIEGTGEMQPTAKVMPINLAVDIYHEILKQEGLNGAFSHEQERRVISLLKELLETNENGGSGTKIEKNTGKTTPSKKANSLIKFRKYIQSSIIAVLSILLFISVLFNISHKKQPNPETTVSSQFGEILRPYDHDETTRDIIIVGQTQNLPEDRQYVWLTVDVPSIGLCWPKIPRILPNCQFRTSIYEGGNNKNFIVSLYAVDKKYNDLLLEYMKNKNAKQSYEGFPILPKEFFIDSVILKLENPKTNQEYGVVR